MKKNVFINSTAATSGGALTILRQVLDIIQKDTNNVYYIFCSKDFSEEYNFEHIKFVTNIEAKRWKDRIIWDMYGMKSWSRKFNIYPNIIISLQNTGVRFNKNITQLIYLHQPLPFCNEKWNVLNKEERILWFYKNIYDKWIRLTLNKNSIIIVQSEWLKNKVSIKYKIDLKRIYVIKPNVKILDSDNIFMNKDDIVGNKFKIFYPASNYKYKNHELIIKSINLIKNKNVEIYSNLEVYFTLDKNKSKYLFDLVRKLKLNDIIKFIGYINTDEMDRFYRKSDLVVFPSYIETFGLPLIEAAQYGKPIITVNREYAYDVIGKYNGVEYVDYKNEEIWAEKIIDKYNKRVKYKSFVPSYNNEWIKFLELIDKFIS